MVAGRTGGTTWRFQAIRIEMGEWSFPNKRILETIHEIPACDITQKTLLQ